MDETLTKDMIVIPSFGEQALIREGSEVIFVDGSYTLSITNKGLEKTPVGLSKDIYTVIAINVTCPTSDKLEILVKANNCIVRNNVNGMITFCSDLNIRNIKFLGENSPRRK